MSAKNFGKMVVLSVVLVCMSAGFLRAGELGLQEKLSKEVKIRLNDVTIADALEKIGQKAGVKFVLSEEAEWKLPQGEATRLSVTLDGPLAESMTEMLNVFFMRYAVGREEVTIYPRPELEHILGRPTAGQLELLKKMYTTVLTFGGNSTGAVIKTMIGDVFGEDVVIVPIEYYSRLTKIAAELGKGLPGDKASPRVTLTQMLDSIGNRWYLSGMDFPNRVTEIRVVHDTEFLTAKLDQIVDISFDENAEVIIQRLVNWTGMELIVKKEDPSWLQEEISVGMQNTKLQQAIRNIVTTVDGYVDIDIGRNRITVYGPRNPDKVSQPQTRGRRPAASASDGYVGKISIPMDGGKYYVEFMLRESDLTEQLKKLREEKMEEVLGQAPSPTPAAAPKPTATEKK